MPGSYLSAYLHVNDTTALEFADRPSRVLPALILGGIEGQIILDLPVDPASASRFLRRLAQTAHDAATRLTTEPTHETNGS
jgi:hypothetical protein